MLKELFSANPYIVINTDLDGFLCGMLLQKHFDCKIAGFSNSKESIWLDASLPDSFTVLSPVYIDMFVSDPKVVCIDQHVIGINNDHNTWISRFGTKINPNLERTDRTLLDDYSHKYPFGTAHYIIALMAREGIDVDLPPLGASFDFTMNGHQCSGLEFGHVLLRADDALHTTLVKYRDNANEWWQWLFEKSNQSALIGEMIGYIRSIPPEQSAEIRQTTNQFFTKCLKCDKPDGAFENITAIDGTLLPKISSYISVMEKISGMSLSLPTRYRRHKGILEKAHISAVNKRTISFFKSPKLFSYAFISGPYAENNISYTYGMK